MKRFNDLDGVESLEHYPELISNSNILLNSANLIAEKGNYGVATSLTILGGEELVKGILLYLHGYGINVHRIKALKKVFWSHKPKHETAMFIEFLNVFEGIIKAGNLKEKRYSTKKGLDKFRRILDQITTVAQSVSVTFDNLEWWSEADNLKNRGLYVDYRDRLLLTTDISLNDFERAKNIIGELNNRFEFVREFFQEGSSEYIKEVSEYINEHIEVRLT